MAPKGVLVSTADACAVGCRFCFRADTGRDVLSVETYARALSRLGELGVEEVCLSGGEPTDHSDFRQLVRVTLQFGLRCAVVTAARPGRRLDALVGVSSMLSHVTVSADTRQAERLGRTGRTIASTAPVFEALGHQRASLHVTVLDLGEDDLDDIEAVVTGAGVRVEVSPLLPSRSFRFENPKLGDDLDQMERMLGMSDDLRDLVDTYHSYLDGSHQLHYCESERLYLSADGFLRRCPYEVDSQISVHKSRSDIRAGVDQMFAAPPHTSLACAAICRSSRTPVAQGEIV